MIPISNRFRQGDDERAEKYYGSQEIITGEDECAQLANIEHIISNSRRIRRPEICTSIILARAP